MQNHGVCLAGMDGFGQVYDCGSCGNIHVQVGPVNITLEPKAYMQFVAMISTSAANFETWLQQKSGVDFTSMGPESTPNHVQDESNFNQKGIQ